MEDNNKAVGPLAAAKLVALIKAMTAKKYDKTGGKIDGSAEITGGLKVGMSSEFSSSIKAGSEISSDMLLMAPIVILHDPATEESISFGVSGESAAKVTSPVSGGGAQYARLAVGTPTGENDAATKAYVDAQLADDTYFDVYVSIADTPVSDLDIASGTYVADCTASHTYAEIKAAADAGKTPRVLVVDDVTKPGADHIICPLVGTSGSSYRFSAPNNIGVGGTAYIVITHIDNDYVLYSCSAGELPAVKDTDNGKYMLVDGGAWKAKVPPVATQSAAGMMSADDKKKLDSCAPLPAVDSKKDTMLIQVVDGAYVLRTKESIFPVDDALDTESKNAVENGVIARSLEMLHEETQPANSNRAGLMSASDYIKLRNIESGATKTTVDAALDATSTNPVQNKAVKAALDNKADKTALDTKADTTVATAGANGLMSAADKKKLDSMYDIVATSTDGETFDITPAQLHEKLKGVPTACAIKVVDTIIPLHRVQLPGDGSTKYIFQTTKDNGFWEPNTRLAYTASAGGTYAGTIWGKSEYDLLASTPGILKFTGAAEAQFSGSKDVTIDIPTGEGAVRYDETQKLTSDQKFRASQNIGAVSQKHAFIDGVVMLQAIGHDDGTSVVNITPSEKSNDYTLTLDGGPENVPVYVAGLETPTDAQTDYAANVAYVKAKIAEAAASGGVDVDNALSATSTNPVQNKVVKAALDKKAGTAVATTSANGLMSKADKTKLDDIERGANKTTIDSAMSGSSVNPVQNKVIKQYIDDKVAAAGSNITVDAALSTTSTNPVQNKAVKAAIDAKADKTALDAKADKTALDAKLDKTGGTLTGNLTGKYITGTWLQSTAASDLGRTPGKIAVLDDSGWVYYRTPAELLADIGAMSGGDYYTKAETDAAIAVRASTSAYGTTKLSNSTTSSSKTLAATPYAVKTALAQAKAYVDSAIAVAINSAY